MNLNPKAAVIGMAAAAAVLTALGGFYTVSPSEVAVVTRWGKITQPMVGPGLHVKAPWADTAHLMPIAIQDVSPQKPANTYTIDNQEVDVLFNVFFRIPADRAAYVFASVPDYRERLLTMANDRLKSQMGQINIQLLAEKRGEVRKAVLATLVQDAAGLGITVTDVQLTNLQYDRQYRDAVAQAAVQKANVESYEYQRQQAEKSADTAKIKALGAANAAREKAKGDADANLSLATAEAKAIQLKGLAQAQAIKAQAEALKSSPELVEYRKAERWDGKLPSAVYSGAPIPFFNQAK